MHPSSVETAAISLNNADERTFFFRRRACSKAFFGSMGSA